MNYLRSWYHKSSLKVKWSLGGSAAIFFTFFIFSSIQYTVIRQVMLHEEATNISQELSEIINFYKNRPFSSMEDIQNNSDIIKQLLEKDQTLYVLNQKLQGFAISKTDNKKPKSLIEYEPVKEKTVDLTTIDGRKIYVGRAPIVSNGFSGYIGVVDPLTRYHQMMTSLFLIMSILGAVSLLLSGLVGFLMAESFLKPMKKLSDTMKSIRKKGFQERMEPSESQDEMGELTNIFNEMMDRIELSFNQQKQFVEDASHELRTPVQIMEGHLNLLNRWGKNDPDILNESLQASLQELGRMKNLVQELLDLSKVEQVENKSAFQNTVVIKTLNRVVKNFELIHEDFDFLLHYDQLENGIVRMSENHFEQIMIILLDNAVKYSEQIKKVDIIVEESKEDIKITVKDYGVGIPEKDLPKIFHRFYRVDKARSRAKGGNGLGLAIAKNLVEGYSGTISASSTLGEGTSISLTLPHHI
ncbi:histidine kinase [Heyndrickxia shackletonii]|uniref:Signal transduction histidine-protein kinase ArlS n=1 Tax=Heyndrickxia shackletonii TaxID=157838 RepID=A0A0Q3WY42_9BACI|nr:HAMP domain-containing histidine kinase [Heyndrickxia shackletonii]KQL53837.1 histidine kinase [Heyndrickxia shackletonii]MBB2481920.1 HAMP domain-containing sensor histidine kinase [Bacillus sp. APMAM]NEY97892.1 HAMP domain-containing histidine kinase [Heyndrickxia shackletonii]RTZ54765.1 HAMP domain-containing histidine kinase [Bacillus sp. SAJ1]